MTTYRLLIHGAKEIVQVVDTTSVTRLSGKKEANDIAILNDPTHRYSILVDNDGKIAAVGTDDQVQQRLTPNDVITRTIKANNKTVMPGLVDGHTHAVFAGDRVHEFVLKLAGASYMEVHKAGGGIHFTVDSVQKSTENELVELLATHIKTMIRNGTTLVEIKSGYGLNWENELKMLRVIEKAKTMFSIDISSTYCGAHAIPKNSTSEQATDDVVNVQIPNLKKEMNNGSLAIENIDVFTEKNCFDVKQTKKILKAGQNIGLKGNFHAEELSCMNSAEMGAELKVTAMSHLEEISPEGIHKMATNDVIATLLPTTAYILRLTPPPARAMLDAGVCVCLGSDFNPNAPCLAMPLVGPNVYTSFQTSFLQVMHLACVLMRLTPNESLAAATINAAASLDRGATHGAISVGRQGDLLIVDAHRWEHLIYQLGNHNSLIEYVIKRGSVVHEQNWAKEH